MTLCRQGAAAIKTKNKTKKHVEDAQYVRRTYSDVCLNSTGESHRTQEF